MTDNTNLPVELILDEAKSAISTRIGFEFAEGELQTVNASDLLAVYLAGQSARTDQAPAIVDGVEVHKLPMLMPTDESYTDAGGGVLYRTVLVDTFRLSDHLNEMGDFKALKDYVSRPLRERCAERAELLARVAELEAQQPQQAQ